MSDKELGKEQAKQLTNALHQAGVSVDVEFSSRKATLNGAKFTFHDAGAPDDTLTLDLLNQRLQSALTNLPADAGKRLWLESFSSFLEDKNKEAQIDGNKNDKDPGLRQLIENSKNMSAIKPRVWDLQADGVQPVTSQTGHGNLVNVAKALTNIARLQNQDVHFKVDAGGQLTYYSNNLNGDMLTSAARTVIEGAVASNSLLSPNGQTLNASGQELANNMIESKTQHVSLSVGSHKPAELVNMIENRQIQLAAEEYLSDQGISVTTNNGHDVYKSAANASGKPAVQDIRRDAGKLFNSVGRLPGLNGIRRGVNQANQDTREVESIGKTLGGKGKAAGSQSTDDGIDFRKGADESSVIGALQESVGLMPVAEADLSAPFTAPAGTKQSGGTKKHR